METIGQSLIRGANEALAIAKGEMCAATVHRVKSVQARFNNEDDHDLQKTCRPDGTIPKHR